MRHLMFNVLAYVMLNTCSWAEHFLKMNWEDSLETRPCEKNNRFQTFWIDFRQSIHLQSIHLGHKRLLNVYQSVFKRLTDAFQSFLSQINRLTNVCQSIVIFSQGMRFWRMETKVVKHKKSDFPEPVKLFSPFIQRFSALKTTFSKST